MKSIKQLVQAGFTYLVHEDKAKDILLSDNANGTEVLLEFGFHLKDVPGSWVLNQYTQNSIKKFLSTIYKDPVYVEEDVLDDSSRVFVKFKTKGHLPGPTKLLSTAQRQMLGQISLDIADSIETVINDMHNPYEISENFSLSSFQTTPDFLQAAASLLGQKEPEVAEDSKEMMMLQEELENRYVKKTVIQESDPFFFVEVELISNYQSKFIEIRMRWPKETDSTVGAQKLLDDIRLLNNSLPASGVHSSIQTGIGGKQFVKLTIPLQYPMGQDNYKRLRTGVERYIQTATAGEVVKPMVFCKMTSSPSF